MNAPCRVSVDLQRNEAEQLLSDEAEQAFDEFDDDLMHDLLGNERMAKPVQDLLIALRQHEKYRGGLTADEIVPMLQALRKACAEQWNAQQ